MLIRSALRFFLNDALHKVKYHEDRFDSFSMWLEGGNYMMYKYKNTYYKLTRPK
jgi:hypothetical protein